MAVAVPTTEAKTMSFPPTDFLSVVNPMINTPPKLGLVLIIPSISGKLLGIVDFFWVCYDIAANWGKTFEQHTTYPTIGSR